MSQPRSSPTCAGRRTAASRWSSNCAWRSTSCPTRSIAVRNTCSGPGTRSGVTSCTIWCGPTPSTPERRRRRRGLPSRRRKRWVANQLRDGELGDVILPGDRRVWLDGGPIRHRDPIEGLEVVHVLQLAHGCADSALPNATHAELAPDQLAAVVHDGGSARIIAPAGSGKTRVLTERARHLRDVWRLPAAALSLVAFNKRAQVEMQARTADLARAQRAHAQLDRAGDRQRLGAVRPATAALAHDRRARGAGVARSASCRHRRKLNVDPLAPWIDALSTMRLGLLDPALVEAAVRRRRRRLGRRVAALPRRARAAPASVDFDDQIRRAIDVLLTQPEARRAAQRACRVLLVDEFQDLTPAHMLLVRLLTARGGAVFGVGDDDQTIYGYNGADPGWLIDFDRRGSRAPATIRSRSTTAVRPAWSRSPIGCCVTIAGASPRRFALPPRRRPPTLVGTSTTATIRSRPPSAAVDAALAAGAAPARDRRPDAGQRHDRARPGRARRRPVSRSPAESAPTSSSASRVRSALAWIRLAVGAALDTGRPRRGHAPAIARASARALREWVGEQIDVDGLLRLADRLKDDEGFDPRHRARRRHRPPAGDRLRAVPTRPGCSRS